MAEDPKLLEKEAHTLLVEGKNIEAQKILKKIAIAFKLDGKHRQAALNYAAAASTSGKVYGDNSHYAAALLYQEAAEQAEKYQDFDYSSMLYKYAAINFEHDGEFDKFSECFFNSKESRRRALGQSLRKRDKNAKGLKNFVKRFIQWCALTFSSLVWGYGEKPFRTLLTGIVIIFIAACLYTQGGLIRNGLEFMPSLFDASYFSVATITTLGYGDIAPVGLSRAVAMVEAFCGIFIMPLFIVGLSRKYLRI